MLSAVNALEKAGAQFIIIAANSTHSIFNEIEKHANVPLISIVKVAAENASQNNLKKLLLLGIEFTMQSTFYHKVFKQFQIKLTVPSVDQQKEINKIIFEELVIGIFKDTSKNRLLRIISQYDVDGVVLGCTELPLILKQKDCSIKLIDTLKLHAEAALDYSLSSSV